MTARTFVISDPHFGHANIIKYCQRPFSNVREMDEMLIKGWNSTITDQDTIICNGDFCFGDPQPYLDQLCGRKILIKGNHDKRIPQYMRSRGNGYISSFTAVHDDMSIMTSHGTVYMNHYPLWQPKYANKHSKVHQPDVQKSYRYFLYGHVHNGNEDFAAPPGHHNICVEKTDYKPVDLEEFLKGKSAAW